MIVLGQSTVSVTFALFHIVVAWPKVKGTKNQVKASEDLIKAIKDSGYRKSWECLPEVVRTHLEKFGK